MVCEVNGKDLCLDAPDPQSAKVVSSSGWIKIDTRNNR